MNIEQRLREAMTARAAGGGDLDQLLTGAIARRKRRRMQQAGGLALVAVAVLVAGTAIPALGIWSKGTNDALPGVAPTPAASPTTNSPPPTPAGLSLPVPPFATGAVTALQNPGVVGADPSLLHMSFDISSLAMPTTTSPVPEALSTEWTSRDDNEYLRVRPFNFFFHAGSNAVDDTKSFQRTGTATVAGKPATVYRWDDSSNPAIMVLWEPVAGLPVTLQAPLRYEQEIISVAERLRLDRVSRCEVNFEVISLPASATLDLCVVTYVDTSVAVDGLLEYSRPDGSRLTVQSGKAIANPPQLQDATPVTVNGRPGFWRAGEARQASGPDGHRLTVYAIEGLVTVFISGGFTKQEAEQLATTMRFR